MLHPSIAKKVVQRVADRPVPGGNHSIETLTEREIEVLRLAAYGYSNRQIAEDLIVSPRTVQSHMANIFDKLDVGSRTEAVMVGLRRVG